MVRCRILVASVGVLGGSALLPSGCAHSAASRISSPAVAAARTATPTEACLLLHRVGVSADALAAMGASEDQVRQICHAARAVCDAQSPSFGDLLEAEARHAARMQALTEKVRSGQARPGDRAALAAARENLQNSRDLQENLADQLRQTVNAVLDANQRAWLENIARNAGVEAPVTFRVVARTDAEWVALRDQANAARARGEAPAPPDGDSAASAAVYESCRVWVAEAWDAALGRP
jgi:hypothetical protein